MNRISKSLFYCLLFFSLFTNISKAQQQKAVKEPPVATMKMLAGVWQKGETFVGSGLIQNFQFSANGQFVFNMGDPNKDLRTVICVKGTYRLTKDRIYFTITSKTVLEGGEILDTSPLYRDIFEIHGAKAKEIKITNPKELAEGCSIIVVSKTRINFNGQDYYKIDQKRFPLGDDVYKW